MSAATASLPLTEDTLRGLGKDLPEHRPPPAEQTAAATSEAAAVAGGDCVNDVDDGYESDATHASMPELIPLDPEPPRRQRTSDGGLRRWPSIPSASEAAAKRAAAAAEAAEEEGARGSGEKRRKLGSRSQPEKRRTPTFFTDSDLNFGVARSTGNPSAQPDRGSEPVNRWIGGYGERQEALAAFLDTLKSSSDPPLQPGPDGDLTRPKSTDDLDLDDFMDGIDVSRADEAKAEGLSTLDPEMADDASSDSTDVEDDDGLFQKPAHTKAEPTAKNGAQASSKNAAGPASPTSSKKVKLVPNHSTRVLRMLPPKQLPPGTPAAANASRQVSQAVASAAQKPSKTKTKSVGRTGDATCEAPSSNTNFGPRFQGLSSDQVQKARASWTLHSLAETPRTSSAENQQAAFAFLQELRRRKEGGTEASTDEKHDGAKPVFRRPPKRAAGEMSATASVAATTASVLSGTFVSEECVVGSRRRVCSISERHERTEVTSSLPRSRAPKRQCVVSFGDDEDF